MMTLPGYELGLSLYKGTRTLVYRAIRTADNQPVIIKFLRHEYPAFSELVQFRNQYTIAKNLNLPGIVRPIALETYGNSYALVMPDEGYIALNQWQPGTWTIAPFLTVAIQLADILQGLSQNRVIHKDIKPANILIHPDTQHVKLIDFSISSLLPKETLQVQNPNVLEGTLAYISPEQTGRMNRGIDYRTDFYALGVTFYELLAGELPFPSDDPMELVHCHIAKMPPPLEAARGEAIPAVSEIVMKLMAKNAENRYQSALGLKRDLETCLYQFKETGKIEKFEVGKWDICDRFVIPEKLYGREVEVNQLLAAFERVAEDNTELMLVAGFSGIGKTAIINEVHKPIVRQRGYFIKGKFDQFNRNIPFSAFVQAFCNLIGQLLGESDAQLAVWKTKILEAVGENGQVIIDVIPELESIVGKQPEVPELSGSAAQSRFHLLFQKFVQVFAQPEHPLTLFLDDLQWADLASLELLKLLMNEAGNFLILGAYRDNEVSPAHPFVLALNDIVKSGAIANTMTLQPLTIEDTNQLVADTLKCEKEIAQALTEIAYGKTQGNPFFTTQFLKALYQEGAIEFDSERGYWQCDLTQVRELALTDDVVEFMASQLQKLPNSTQNMLKLAACIGNQFDLATLAIVSEQSEMNTANALWEALQLGFIFPKSEVYKFYIGQDRQLDRRKIAEGINYSFLHDRVQQAAYSLIPKDRIAATHYEIGKILLNHIPPESREENILKLVNQLNHGIDLITDRTERDTIAHLNLIACRKSRASTAYEMSREYANKGLALLQEDAWNRQYQLSLSFSEYAAELAWLCGDFESMEQWIEIVIDKTRSWPEQANVYRIKIQSYVAQHKLEEAIAIAQGFLQKLGVCFPKDLNEKDIKQAIDEVNSIIGDREIEDLVRLPSMQDEEKIAILKIASSIMAAAAILGSCLFPLVVAVSVKLSIQYGNTELSALAYACYGIVICKLFQDVETGVKFGHLALDLASSPTAKALKSEVLNAVAQFILHRQSHIRQTLPVLQQGYTSALEVGSLECFGYIAHQICHNSILCGQSLSELAQDSQSYCNELVKLNQLMSAKYCQVSRQLILNLLAVEKSVTVLSGAALPDDFLPNAFKANDLYGVFLYSLYELILCYLFRDLESAQAYAVEAKKYLMAANGTIAEPVFYFYDSLTAIANLNSQSQPVSEILKIVQQNQQDLKRHWADHTPMNHQHKVDLVEAEKCRILDQKLNAIELYDRAISAAKEHEYIQEEALANELAAKFYLDWGKEQIAAPYMQEAYYCYAHWGAKAKTDDLEANYPQLLRPILQKTNPTFYPLETLASISAVKSTLCAPTTGTQTSETNANTALDLVTLFKAAQAISSTIDLKELLTQLTQILLHNSGGDRCAIILCEPNQAVQVRAIATVDATDLSSVTLKDASYLPVQLIQYVKNSGEIVVMDSPECNTPVVDRDLAQRQPASVLCLPLVDRSQLRGILYLENQATSGVFHPRRLAALQLLATQAAIALENARLYQQAQDYAQQLEDSQLQLVQSEKMSALGNLVAGVAHEINNPVGFIAGNLQPAQDYVRDLLGLLDLYQAKIPEPDEELEEELEAIDLEFLRDDLPKLLASMKEGTDRIRHISTSLRTFSRTDKDYKVPFNLHEGLDSTILILKHRLKANQNRPEIEIVKDYDKIPEVKCFPGQLNQVFMNLIANAIDALEESNKERSFAEIQANPNRIILQVQIQVDRVILRIADNGNGMPEEVKKRIFEQGFTTKGVGKGTGLGLAISRQIVVEKHGGSIEVCSTPGRGTEFKISLPHG